MNVNQSKIKVTASVFVCRKITSGDLVITSSPCFRQHRIIDFQINEFMDLNDLQLFTAVVCTDYTAEGFGWKIWHLIAAALFCWNRVAKPAVAITGKKKAPIPLAAAQSSKVLFSVIVPEKDRAKTMKLTSCLWNP